MTDTHFRLVPTSQAHRLSPKLPQCDIGMARRSLASAVTPTFISPTLSVPLRTHPGTSSRTLRWRAAPSDQCETPCPPVRRARLECRCRVSREDACEPACYPHP